MTDPDTTVAVLVRLALHPGKEEEFAQQMHENFARIRREPGCVFIDGYQDEHDPSRFLLVEIWRSRAAFEEFLAHRDYQRDYLARVSPLWANREITYWPHAFAQHVPR